MEVYENRPNFADAEAQDDARQKLAHVGTVLIEYSLSWMIFY